jgi:hypothetical protein
MQKDSAIINPWRQGLRRGPWGGGGKGGVRAGLLKRVLGFDSSQP